jgi:hypothetical protein
MLCRRRNITGFESASVALIFGHSKSETLRQILHVVNELTASFSAIPNAHVRLASLFAEFDADGDGFLTLQDLRKLLQTAEEMRSTTAAKLTLDELTLALNFLNERNQGAMSLKEMKTFFLQSSSATAQSSLRLGASKLNSANQHTTTTTIASGTLSASDSSEFYNLLTVSLASSKEVNEASGTFMTGAEAEVIATVKPKLRPKANEQYRDVASIGRLCLLKGTLVAAAIVVGFFVVFAVFVRCYCNCCCCNNCCCCLLKGIMLCLLLVVQLLLLLLLLLLFLLLLMVLLLLHFNLLSNQFNCY